MAQAWLTSQLREPLGSLATQLSNQLAAVGTEDSSARDADAAQIADLTAQIERLQNTLVELDASHQAELQALVQQQRSKLAQVAPAPPKEVSLSARLKQALGAVGIDAAGLPDGDPTNSQQLAQLISSALGLVEPHSEKTADDSERWAKVEHEHRQGTVPTTYFLRSS